MTREIPIGLCAGVAAAILMLSPLSGSMLGVMLALLAALPITLVTLSWGYRGGLIAAVSAMVVLAGILTVRSGLAFGVSIALPAWGLAYLAVAGFGDNTGNQPRISLGTLVVVAAVLSTLGSLFAMISIGTSYDVTLQNLEKEMTEAFRIILETPKDQPIILSDGQDATKFIHVFSRLMLPMSAFVGTILSLCGLWLSGRITRISGRLPRPWPDIAALRLPQWSLAALGVACVLSLLPDIYGLAGQLLLAATAGAFTLQGFAVLHFVTRRSSMRPLLLVVVYVLCIILNWIALAVIAVVGLLDLFFNLRGRSGSSGRPQAPTPLN